MGVNDTCGFLYIATGQKYVEEARLSVASLRKHNPSCRVTLVAAPSVSRRDAPWANEVVNVNPSGDLRDKVDFISAFTPYDRTIFIDSDTYVCDSLLPLFSILDHFDMAIGFTPFRDPIHGSPASMAIATEYNTGVIAYKKNDNVGRFMKQWKSLYETRRNYYSSNFDGHSAVIPQLENYILNDQHSFAIALIESNIRYFTFTNEWNFRGHSPAVLVGKCKIIHSRSLQSDGYADQINARPMERRVWDAQRVRVLYPMDVDPPRTLRLRVASRIYRIIAGRSNT